MVTTISYKDIMKKESIVKKPISNAVKTTKCPKPIDEIFNEREDFIVVGFTGGTGAGCTSAASILETELFEELKLHKPKNRDFNNNEERKYEIIYDYAKYHWDPFHSISMSDMIISFIIQDGYDAMLNLISTVLGFNEETIFKDAKIDGVLFKDYFDDLKSEFDGCFDEASSYNTLKRSDTQAGIEEKEIECLEKIGKVRDCLKKCLSDKEFNSDDYENSKANAYTYFLQTLGDNLRISGRSSGGEFSGKDMAILARRANGFIKAYRSRNRKNGKKRYCALTQ